MNRPRNGGVPMSSELKPVLYLSGPMSGHDNFNFPAFNAAADALRRLGYPVLNPADFGCHPRHTWADCLQRDLTVMGYADVVVVLPGWQNSKGARLETRVAIDLA